MRLAAGFSSRLISAVFVMLLLGGSAALAQNADVFIIKGDDPDPVVAGAQLGYTIIVANAGPDTASNVSFTDTVPANTTFVGGTAPPGWMCTLPPVGGTGDVTCSIPSLAVLDGNQVFTLLVEVSPSATGTITNSATVTSTTNDPNGANNSTGPIDTTITTSADLSVAKADFPDPVRAGENVSYTIVVSNAGPSDAQNVTLTDTLPAGTTFFDATPAAGFLCTPGVGSVSCTKATVAAGANELFTLILTVDPDTTGTITNNATVTSDTADSNASNDTVNVPTDVVTEADLGVVKVDDVDPVAADGTVIYTVTLTNNGPSDATNIVLTDTIPAGGSVLAGPPPPAGFLCVPGAGTIVCTGATLAAGASVDFVLPFDLDPGTSGQISNSVSVTSDTTDSVPGNDSDIETTDITAVADLQVVKVDDLDPVLTGGTVTYTVTLSNLGPSDATNVVLTDTIPAGGSVAAGPPPPAGWVCVPGVGTIVCTTATFVEGASVNFILPFDIDPGTLGTISNSVSVTSDATDPVPGNNSDTETTEVSESADLSVTKTDAPDPVLAGGNLTYTITVANAGPSAATTIVLDDTVPAETTFVSMTAPAGFACSTPAVGGTGAIQCTGATLASGANSVFTLVVAVDDPATGPISNTATVFADTGDPNAANDTANATTAIATPIEADVSITKTAGAGPFAPGDNIPYTITVTNNGPASATNVAVVDALPAGTTFVSATPSVGSCSGTGPVNCALGTLTNGANATIALIVTSPATAGTLVNNVTVSATETDPTPANNAANASATTVEPAPTDADVSITKTAGAGPFVPGDNIPYTITVINNGPASATNVTVVDTLPAGTTFVSATPSVGSCSGTGPVNCTLGTLANGANATIALIVTSPATAGTFVNNVTVSATETDPTPANGAASAAATTGDPAAIPFTSPWVLLLLAATLAVVGATRFRI